MAKLNYALISENQRFKLLATYLDLNKLHKVLVLFGTEAQVQFFESIFTNISPKIPLNFGIIGEDNAIEEYQQVVLMDVPNTFQQITAIVNKIGSSSHLVLFLFKNNKGYVKMLQKKLSLEFKELTFNPHKLLMVEDKYLEIVDSNYAINRQAFYAYGSFLQYYNKNLLKRIFRTDRLNVKNIGLGFGMSVPPKVNLDAKFLTQKAQHKEKILKKKQRLLRQRQRNQQQSKQIEQQQVIEKPQAVKAIKTKKIQKKPKLVSK